MKLKLFLFIIIGGLGLLTQLYIRPWIYQQDFPEIINLIAGSFPSFCTALAFPIVVLGYLKSKEPLSVLLAMGIGFTAYEVLSFNSGRNEFGFTFDYWDLIATWVGLFLAWKLHNWISN